MKNTIKMLVLAVAVIGFGSLANAQDLFTNTTTTNEGLNGSLMAVTPDANALAAAATTYDTAGSLQTSALNMIPNGNNGSFGYDPTPNSGFSTAFDQTGVADAFSYGSGPFVPGFGGSSLNPQTAPGDPTTGDTIDQIVSKYTASGNFAQNMHSAVTVNNNPDSDPGNGNADTLFTLEQGDLNLAGTAAPVSGDPLQILKISLGTSSSAVVGDNVSGEAATGGGIAFGGEGIHQLVQQSVGTGPFTSCLDCLSAVIGPVIIQQTTDTGPNFTPDTVVHPGP
ncbi:MAG TPA: hypothetical protein VFG95_00640 [Nitrospiria bacterium]|nr:hypothetical protein [Nitrospiria bacterium]